VLDLERSTASKAPAAASVPPDLLEKLGALGYVGSGEAAPGSAGADPKDKLEDFKATSGLVREALVHLREGDPAGSATRLQQVLGRGIEGFEVHYYLGRALFDLKHFSEAARHFEEAIRRQPFYGAAYKALADCRAARGDPAAALAALRQGVSRSPRDATLRQAEARLLRRGGRHAEARKAYEEALALAPRDALVRIELGELLRDAGESERAIGLMREALALDPEPAAYWNALGMVLGGAGRMAEAEAAFREATKRSEGDAQYAYNLGLALQRQGRGPEARLYFAKALKLQPRFRAARERLAELGSPP
jgi:tetratricopeptide (TPR) repeat protein